jgi:hypothetical protein
MWRRSSTQQDRTIPTGRPTSTIDRRPASVLRDIFCDVYIVNLMPLWSRGDRIIPLSISASFMAWWHRHFRWRTDGHKMTTRCIPSGVIPRHFMRISQVRCSSLPGVRLVQLLKEKRRPRWNIFRENLIPPTPAYSCLTYLVDTFRSEFLIDEKTVFRFPWWWFENICRHPTDLFRFMKWRLFRLSSLIC